MASVKFGIELSVDIDFICIYLKGGTPEYKVVKQITAGRYALKAKDWFIMWRMDAPELGLSARGGLAQLKEFGSARMDFMETFLRFYIWYREFRAIRMSKTSK